MDDSLYVMCICKWKTSERRSIYEQSIRFFERSLSPSLSLSLSFSLSLIDYYHQFLR